MKITNLEETEEPIKYPISISLPKSKIEQWENINYRLKKFSKKNRISNYARKVIYEMMDDLDRILKDKESNSASAT